MKKVLCVGDSIVEAGSSQPPKQWPTLLQQKLNAWRPAMYQVIKQGSPGATSSIGFDCVPFDVIPHLPATTLVHYGFNDAAVSGWTTFPRTSLFEFEKNLRGIRETVHKSGGKTVFIVPHPIPVITPAQGNGKLYNVNVEPYRPMVRQTAASMGDAFIDIPLELASRGITADQVVTADKIHLNDFGQSAYAEIVFERLKPLLP